MTGSGAPFSRARVRRRLAETLVAALAVLLLHPSPSTARADSWPADPADPATPTTVAVDRLPTAQIDGVAWYQVVVGRTVYVAGRFAHARPAGAAAGQSTVPRNNLLAYDLVTGALLPFNPDLNGQAFALAASPDGSRLYVGGEFTTVGGLARPRIAALDPTSGAVISAFGPRPDATVRAIVATSSTVYLGGLFGSVDGNVRARLAAVRPSDGTLLPWAPRAEGGKVNALAVSPAQDKVVVGGSFTTLNGSSRPGYGLGAVDAGTGGLVPWAANDVVRNAGNDSAILSLTSDGAGTLYGTGYIYGTGGNLEGAFSAGWGDGRITWVEDCHGDSYGIYPSATAVYVAGHPHYCLNLGGYPEQQVPQRAVAFSRAATGRLTPDTRGYPSFTGQPSPALQNFFPQLTTGTATGQNQAAWTVTGSGDYVVYAGEFMAVNGTPQQGLVRFANRQVAPNKQGPKASGTSFQPTASSPSPGQVRVGWTSSYDYDNTHLTYSVLRDGGAAPVCSTTQPSTFWSRPALACTDTGVPPGQHAYVVRASDPFGNTVTSPPATVTVAAVGNVAPAAAFTSTVSGRTVSADGGGSSDSDGTISSYAWTWGDGQTASGRTATHTYGADGTFTVTLTVTDDDGASASTSRPVPVSGAAVPLASDSFSRTVGSGFGAADAGGGWTVGSPSSAYAVADGQGLMTIGAAGRSTSAYLGSTSSTSVDLAAGFALDRVPDVGGGYFGLVGRRVASDDYRLKVKVAPDSSLTLYTTRFVGGVETTLQTTTLTGVRYTAGTRVKTRLQVVGTGTTSVRAKAWLAGTAEPASWQLAGTDATASLQAAGSVGVHGYVSGSATNPGWSIRVDDLVAGRV